MLSQLGPPPTFSSLIFVSKPAFELRCRVPTMLSFRRLIQRIRSPDHYAITLWPPSPIVSPYIRLNRRYLHLFLQYITLNCFHRPGPAWRLSQLKPTALYYLFQAPPGRSVARRALAFVVNTRNTPSIYAYVPYIGLLFLFFPWRVTGCPTDCAGVLAPLGSLSYGRA